VTGGARRCLGPSHHAAQTGPTHATLAAFLKQRTGIWHYEIIGNIWEDPKSAHEMKRAAVTPPAIHFSNSRMRKNAIAILPTSITSTIFMEFNPFDRLGRHEPVEAEAGTYRWMQGAKSARLRPSRTGLRPRKRTPEEVPATDAPSSVGRPTKPN
jgi:hypothetical protein